VEVEIQVGPLMGLPFCNHRVSRVFNSLGGGIGRKCTCEILGERFDLLDKIMCALS